MGLFKIGVEILVISGQNMSNKVLCISINNVVFSCLNAEIFILYNFVYF